MTTNADWQEAGIHHELNSVLAVERIAASALLPNRLLDLTSAGKVQHAAASSKAVFGASRYATPSGFTAIVPYSGPVILEAEVPITAGKPIKAGTAGKAIGFIDSTVAGGTIKTTGAGIAFGNQPANDGVEVVSSSAADDSQSATIIGTTQGTDTVVVETVALDGTTPVATTKTDWGFILAVKLDGVCAGTVTVREASADQAITTLTTGVLSKGVETVTGDAQRAFNQEPTLVGSDTGTKVIGLQGTDAAGAVQYDAQALNGATAVTANLPFQLVTEVYTGDLEASRTATIAVGAADSDEERVGVALEAQDTAGGIFKAVIHRR